MNDMLHQAAEEDVAGDRHGWQTDVLQWPPCANSLVRPKVIRLVASPPSSSPSIASPQTDAFVASPRSRHCFFRPLTSHEDALTTLTATTKSLPITPLAFLKPRFSGTRGHHPALSIASNVECLQQPCLDEEEAHKVEHKENHQPFSFEWRSACKVITDPSADCMVDIEETPRLKRRRLSLHQPEQIMLPFIM